MQEIIIFAIPILIMSAVFHEVSHGYMALVLGDPTAKLAGRLTLNPFKHLDPFGSVILPTLLVLINSPFLIAYAKPVPFNPYNLRSGKWGPGLVAAAGPLTNLLIVIFFSIVIRLGFLGVGALPIIGLIVLINLILAIFNLIPFPPLDGSKIVASLIPFRYYSKWMQFEALVSQYGLIALFAFLFLFVYFVGPVFSVLLAVLFEFFTGESIGLILGLFQ